jgi:DNA-binding GntR family transcriptional regulator
MNGKDLEGSGSGLMEDYPSIYVERLRKTTEKPLSQDSQFLSKYKIRHLNSNEKCDCLK